MISARKERVRELIRSLECRRRREGVGRQVVLLDGDRGCQDSQDAAHAQRESGDNIQSAISHMTVAVGGDSPTGT